MADKGEYELAGYRLEGGDWRDVEDGAPLPTKAEWGDIDLITLNLAPDTEDGFYRSANVLGGLDGIPDFDYLNTSDEEYTLDDLAYELALEYGYAAQ